MLSSLLIANHNPQVFTKATVHTYTKSAAINICPEFNRIVATFIMLLQLLALAALHTKDVLSQASGSQLGADGFIRFGCSQLVVERTDPLVTPGLNPSPHMQYVSQPQTNHA